MTRIVRVGGGSEGGIKDHSQSLTRATGKKMLSFTNKGKTQGEGWGYLEPKQKRVGHRNGER